VATALNASAELVEFLRQNPIRPEWRHSVTARAARDRCTFQTPDMQADPELSYGSRDVDPVRTVLGVPVLKGEDLLGVILIYRMGVKLFTEKQVALVETFADQAAIAIENVRLFDEVQARTRELSQSVEELRALGEVGQAINSTLDLETVLTTIVAKAVQLSGTEAGAIYTFDESGQEFRLRATHGMDETMVASIRGRRIGAGETVIGKAAAERTPIQIPDVLEQSSLFFDVI